MSDRYLFFYVAALTFAGALFALSLPLYLTQRIGVAHYYFFIRQISYALLSIFLIWFIARLDADRWATKIGFGLFFIFFALMFFMPFMPETLVPTINGARRWIRFGSLSVTPVEFFKVGFIYFLAWSLTRKLYRPKTTKESFTFAQELGALMPYAAIFLVAVILIAVMQNDIGQVVVLGSVMALMIFFAGSSVKVFLFLIGVSFFGGIALILQARHRIERVLQWWSSAQDFILSLFPNFIADVLRIEESSASAAYQVTQSMHAIHHGGLMGVGLGGGVVKLGFLSDAHNDFALAGIAEETGLFGIMLVSILILLAIYRIFKIANRSENPIFYLFSIGVGVMIASQFLMNALGATGIIPIKGIPAPFLSYGGASLVAFSVAIGLVLMISKKARA
ncbi:MAG: FtsW/RodA/SpoVE family cell cycle protein [Helicobacteraceae bacterium]|nr:FtsW/RodA/SpoVE family cell cycle protein [Helicobacteraceae bacterium]